MLIIEFERCKPDAIAVRVLDPTADTPEDRIVAEEIYAGGLPDGLELKRDAVFAALRLPSYKALFDKP